MGGAERRRRFSKSSTHQNKHRSCRGSCCTQKCLSPKISEEQWEAEILEVLRGTETDEEPEEKKNGGIQANALTGVWGAIAVPTEEPLLGETPSGLNSFYGIENLNEEVNALPDQEPLSMRLIDWICLATKSVKVPGAAPGKSSGVQEGSSSPTRASARSSWWPPEE